MAPSLGNLVQTPAAKKILLVLYHPLFRDAGASTVEMGRILSDDVSMNELMSILRLLAQSGFVTFKPIPPDTLVDFCLSEQGSRIAHRLVSENGLERDWQCDHGPSSSNSVERDYQLIRTKLRQLDEKLGESI